MADIGWAKWAPRAQESLNEWIYDEETDTLIGMSQIPAPDYQERRIPLSKALHFVTTSSKGNPEGRSPLRNARRSCYMKTKSRTWKESESSATSLVIRLSIFH